MPNTNPSPDATHKESPVRTISGWPIVPFAILLPVGFVASLIRAKVYDEPLSALVGFVLLFLGLLLISGFYLVQPNQSKVLILFGDYVGTARKNGFWWTNPFTKKIPLSLRARTLNGEKLKVNELSGNPIEIAAVVVWRVRDTAQAEFDVDDYAQYVMLQSETAVRKMASAFPYDGAENTVTLRRATDEVNHHLQDELQARVARAGVEIVEARLSHLAYAPEIAGAMLQRQQAQAVVDARTKIVEGAVGMVEHALEELSAKSIVELDDERKATMVGNLMVVLCGDHSVQPVVNAGSLY